MSTVRTRGGRQPQPLTLSDVVTAACRVVAARGLDQLTVKSVADELGVTSPAVYHYAAGKDELVARVCERVASSVDLDVDDRLAWDEQIIALVTGMRETFARYPGVGERSLSLTGPAPAAEAISARVIEIASSAGFAIADATRLSVALQLLFSGSLLHRPPFLPAAQVGSAERASDGLSDGLRFILAGFDGTAVRQTHQPPRSSRRSARDTLE